MAKKKAVKKVVKKVAEKVHTFEDELMAVRKHVQGDGQPPQRLPKRFVGREKFTDAEKAEMRFLEGKGARKQASQVRERFEAAKRSRKSRRSN